MSLPHSLLNPYFYVGYSCAKLDHQGMPKVQPHENSVLNYKSKLASIGSSYRICYNYGYKAPVVMMGKIALNVKKATQPTKQVIIL